MTNYKEIAREARKAVIGLIYKAQTSHVGSNLSAIDLLTVLYDKANLDKNLSPDRDRIIISKGWIAASVYYFLAQKGILDWQEVYDGYCDGKSKYIGLVEPYVRGIEVAGGAMGHGLPMGVGMALGAKRSNKFWHTFVLMSDGEMDCGTTWESALLAAHHKLDNLTVIVDYNKIQATGNTNEILNIEPLVKKWESFGWNLIGSPDNEQKDIDGHNFKEIECALDIAKSYSNTDQFNGSHKPSIIIANTIKGKGVSFMENKLLYHYKNLSDDEYKRALEELK